MPTRTIVASLSSGLSYKSSQTYQRPLSQRVHTVEEVREITRPHVQELVDACDNAPVTYDPTQQTLREAFEEKVTELLAAHATAPPNGSWSAVAVRHVPSGGGWATTSTEYYAYPTYQSSTGTWHLGFHAADGEIVLPEITLA